MNTKKNESVKFYGYDYIYSYFNDGNWVVIRSNDLYGIEDIVVA